MHAPTPAPTDTPTLDSLREQGAQRLEPVRFAYLQALSRHTAQATGAVQPLLQARLDAALADTAQRLRAAQAAAGRAIADHADRPEQARALRQWLKTGDWPALRQHAFQAGSADAGGDAALLAGLNRYLWQRSQAGADSGLAPNGAAGDAAPAALTSAQRDARPEMKSVRRFREVWSRIAAVEQADRAMVRGPENAGPLNSHMLVLRSLARMRELSPDYLRRFLSQAETLLWLDAQSQRPAPAEARPARKPRQKK